MSLEISHVFLVEGSDCLTCRQQVERFLARTQLVRYDVIRIEQERCRPAQALGFWEAVGAGVAENRRFVEELTAELTAGGYLTLQDFLVDQERFPSKTLHIIAHVLDGFFGIDSSFYNLVEDSHWVSEKLKAQISSTPERFWLIEVKGMAASQAAASVLHSNGDKVE